MEKYRVTESARLSTINTVLSGLFNTVFGRPAERAEDPNEEEEAKAETKDVEAEAEAEEPKVEVDAEEGSSPKEDGPEAEA